MVDYLGGKEIKQVHTRDLFSLNGKTSIVTGGTTGLGKQMASALSDMGSDVVIASLDQSLCDEIAKEINHNNSKSLGIELDLANIESIQNVIEKTIKEFHKIDVLVNCAAAVGTTTPFDPISMDAWEKMVRINLSGTFWISHEVAEVMKKQKSGKIINICSVYALAGVDVSLYTNDTFAHFEHFPYSITKGGVLSMTKDMAVNYARWNINVNSISPGMFPSPTVKKKYGEEVFEKLRNRTPLKRLGGEDDLKGAIVYLASSASDYVTGHNLVVDGGWMAW